MPQLNPSPWFAILVFTWIIFLTIVPTKVLNHLTPNGLVLVEEEEYKNKYWNWPW
uniref:ATP synthase complex subunit 8 n=1 Tax=Meda fulgida TaxID=67549 RepID=A0A0N7AXL4_9TELE|nr:ATP synthase F0 subunit 8 [Meda fulgida]AJW75459.1 ATP synthase F0 subunit 8 [Meda fulgida]